VRRLDMTPCIRHVQFLDGRKMYWGDQYEAHRYFLVSAGNLSSPCYDEQSKTLISCVSTVACTPSIWESYESNPTPSLRSMSILFPSYNSIFQVLSFLQIFSARSCPVCIRFVSCVPYSSLTSSPAIGLEYVQAVKLLITRIFPSLLLLPPS
jgi:hypothetical protein